jgi:uroporphyrinogen-III synthase
MPKVLLLKSESGSNKYAECLQSNGFEVAEIITIDFQFKSLDLLGEKLGNPGNYSGIIFTSPRSVSAVAETDKKDLSNWSALDNYCVGETTYDLVKSLLNLETKGKLTGNANNLATFIKEDLNNKAITKPFLFPCGNLKQDILERKLMEFGFKLEPIEVYSTIPHKNIKSSLEKFKNPAPDYFIYFSPSGVKFTIDSLRELEIDLDLIKFVAIGPSTERALLENGLKVYRVCEKPNPESLLKALL